MYILKLNFNEDTMNSTLSEPQISEYQFIHKNTYD